MIRRSTASVALSKNETDQKKKKCDGNVTSVVLKCNLDKDEMLTQF